jgi:serine/threonine protein phosphatase PrpC
MIICVNLGDSRAILSKSGQVVELSKDHKPNNEDEKARIKKAGGSIHKDRI